MQIFRRIETCSDLPMKVDTSPNNLKMPRRSFQSTSSARYTGLSWAMIHLRQRAGGVANTFQKVSIATLVVVERKIAITLTDRIPALSTKASAVDLT